MSSIVNRNNGAFGINKKNLKIKCVSCKDLLPLTMFVKQDLNILRKTENALCKACRTVCRNCGVPIIKSSGQRLKSRKEFLEQQLAISSTQNLETNGKRPKTEEERKQEEKNLWEMDYQTGEEKRTVVLESDDINIQSKALKQQQTQKQKQKQPHPPSAAAGGRSLSKAERESFAKSDNGMYCQTCSEREMIASTNVYYRFPMLRYRACPFPTDKYRAIIADELAEHRGRSLRGIETEKRDNFASSSSSSEQKSSLKKKSTSSSS